jgi:hypothetical protein
LYVLCLLYLLPVTLLLCVQHLAPFLTLCGLKLGTNLITISDYTALKHCSQLIRNHTLFPVYTLTLVPCSCVDPCAGLRPQIHSPSVLRGFGTGTKSLLEGGVAFWRLRPRFASVLLRLKLYMIKTIACDRQQPQSLIF